jgi:hypothetical protein
MLCRKHWRHIAVAVAVVMELALVALDRQIIQQLCFRLVYWHIYI